MEQMPDGGSTEEENEETSDNDSDASVVKQDRKKKSPKEIKRKRRNIESDKNEDGEADEDRKVAAKRNNKLQKKNTVVSDSEEDTEDDDENNDELQKNKKKLKNTKKRTLEDGDDEDSLTGAAPVMTNKPWLDLTTEEIAELPKERSRKKIDVLVPDTSFYTQARTPKKNVPTVDKNTHWWTGHTEDSKPDMTFNKGVFPLYTKIQNSTETTFEDLASDNLMNEDHNEPGDYQTSQKACQLWVNKSLGRPNNQEELENALVDMSRADKEGLRSWYKNSATAVQDEVNLALLKNKIQLKYVPIPSIREPTRHGCARGHYQALVTIRDKKSVDFAKTKLYKPSNDWVEENFSEEALALVQELERETSREYMPKNGPSKKESGFVPLAKKLTYKEDDVEKQISKMRYLPMKQSRNAMGRLIWLQEAWKGMVQNDRGDSLEIVLLPDEWVQINITKEMQAFLKNLRREGHMGYAYIPEGANDAHEEGVVQFRNDAPRLKFYMTEPASRRCVLDSAASGFAFLGFTRIAWQLSSTKGNKTTEANPMGYVEELLEKHLQREERQAFQWTKLNSKRLKTWNTLVSSQEYMLCILGVRSSDNKTDHAICIVENWIFDSNFEKALELKQESLDICCSSIDRNTGFTKATKGIVLKKR